MASAIETGKSGRRRRDLNAEINLVPFIDLLSASICFLLMTAVWVQLGSVEVKQSYGTEAPDANVGYELNLKLISPTVVGFEASQKGRRIAVYRLEGTSVDDLMTKVDGAVHQILSLPVKAGTPAPTVTSAMIHPNPNVPYGTMVKVMNALRRNQIVNLGVVSLAE